MVVPQMLGPLCIGRARWRARGQKANRRPLVLGTGCHFVVTTGAPGSVQMRPNQNHQI